MSQTRRQARGKPRRRGRTAQAIADDVTRWVGMRPVRVIEKECRPCHGGGWAARYDPKRRTIHLGTKNVPPMMRRALLGHELGHAVADEIVCRMPRRQRSFRRRRFARRCRYFGQHDNKMFFPIVEKIQRHIRTAPAAARTLEHLSGYDPRICDTEGCRPGSEFMRPRPRRTLRSFFGRRRMIWRRQ